MAPIILLDGIWAVISPIVQVATQAALSKAFAIDASIIRRFVVAHYTRNVDTATPSRTYMPFYAKEPPFKNSLDAAISLKDAAMRSARRYMLSFSRCHADAPAT